MRSCRRSSRVTTTTSPSGCGVQDVRRARSPTRSPWWWRTIWASRRRRAGSRSTRPTSTSRHWPRLGPPSTARSRCTTSPRSSGRRTSNPTSITAAGPWSPTLRRTVVFGRLDLTRDPPISRVDLVACRNTLMYLNAETQGFVIPRLQYALRHERLPLPGPGRDGAARRRRPVRPGQPAAPRLRRPAGAAARCRPRTVRGRARRHAYEVGRLDAASSPRAASRRQRRRSRRSRWWPSCSSTRTGS